MSVQVFQRVVIAIAAAFSIYFAAVVIPPLIENPDILGAFRAGFVNPYSSGYSADVLCCWAILLAWVAFEASVYAVRGGWICLLVGVVPGVAVGFAAYLVLRSSQIATTSVEASPTDIA